MTFKEKTFYHQIYPLKLFADIASTIVALYFFWQYQLIAGLLVAFIPPIITSFLIIEFVNLEPYKHSPLGRYLAKHMTRSMESVRLFGAFIMLVGAWFHKPTLIAFGLVVVLFVWLRGLISE